GRSSILRSKSNRLHCSLISAGCSKYGRREGLSGADLFNEALSELFFKCPRLGKSDVNAMFLGLGCESFEHRANVSAAFANNFGFRNIPAVRVESVSSSGASALRQGILAVMSGFYDVVICAGVEKMSSVDTGSALEIISMAADRPFEQWNGATLSALNALAAREHMRKYGTSEEQLAAVAVKNHDNAFENEKAYLRKKISVSEVLVSKKISTPLKLLDCSPVCDGASAIALCNSAIASKFTDLPVDVVGTGEASDSDFVYRQELTGFVTTRLAAKQALDMCDLQIRDMDLIEIHDAFTINEIVAYEDLGLCEKGKGGKLAESGKTAISGEIPVNTSGGLKAKGHPIGSSGIGQVYEVFEQLTGKVSGFRSVKDARIGMTHSMGGAGVDALVHIFERSL
ncbi:MAG: thiolase C-terminal domain-containing protein, partial [Nitrososphaerales archaeon]